MAKKNGKSDWDPVEVHAKRVQTRLNKASSFLPTTDAKMLELALQLGRIYHNVDDLPSKQVRAQIETKVRSLLPASSSKAVRKKLSAANKVKSGFAWAMCVYNLLDHELRWAAP